MLLLNVNGLKIKVADSSIALRFYPYFEQVIQDAPKVDAKAATSEVSNATNATTIPTTSTDSSITSASVTLARRLNPGNGIGYFWLRQVL